MDYETLRDMYEPGDPKLWSLLEDAYLDSPYFGADQRPQGASEEPSEEGETGTHPSVRTGTSPEVGTE